VNVLKYSLFSSFLLLPNPAVLGCPSQSVEAGITACVGGLCSQMLILCVSHYIGKDTL